jgi:hypothetical protein
MDQSVSGITDREIFQQMVRISVPETDQVSAHTPTSIPLIINVMTWVTGIPNHNQCDESRFRSLKRIVRSKANLEHFFERFIPNIMLHHLTLYFRVDTVSCGYVSDQEGLIANGHIHREVLEKA